MTTNENMGHQTSEKRQVGKPGHLNKTQIIDGIDSTLYSRLIKEIGSPARRKKRINVKLAKKMHDAGWSYRQIGLHFKVSGYTVKRRLNEVIRQHDNEHV